MAKVEKALEDVGEATIGNALDRLKRTQIENREAYDDAYQALRAAQREITFARLAQRKCERTIAEREETISVLRETVKRAEKSAFNWMNRYLEEKGEPHFTYIDGERPD
jgi:hypothetical protein